MKNKKKIKISLGMAVFLIVFVMLGLLVNVFFLVQHLNDKEHHNNPIEISKKSPSEAELANLLKVDLNELKTFKDDFIGSNIIIEEKESENFFELSNSKKLEFKQQAEANFKQLETYILNNENKITETILEGFNNKQLYKYENRLGVVKKTKGLDISKETIDRFYAYVLSGMIKDCFKYDKYNITVKEISKNSDIDTDVYIIVNNKNLVIFEYDETECYFLSYDGTEYNSNEEPSIFNQIGGYNSLESWYRIQTSPTTDKPIIYLYPTQKIEVSVKLPLTEQITCSYPKYIDGWKVLADPDGNLIDKNTKKQLYSLYYESKNLELFKIEDEGFIVKGEDTAKFLEKKLEILGLTEREAEEFIIYWLPKLEVNKYNYIRFATPDEINANMPLDINPNPDTVIRVLMTFKGLDNPIKVQEQKLTTPERKGFVAVEWGGTEIK